MDSLNLTFTSVSVIWTAIIYGRSQIKVHGSQRSIFPDGHPSKY